MKRNTAFFTFVLLIVLIAIWPTKTYASHGPLLTGVVDDKALPALPPTSSGPGLLLPDSPLFFLDTLKQQLRLSFAVTPEARTKVHMEVAKERLAELRYMVARENRAAIRFDLQDMTEHVQKASVGLAATQFAGKNVSELAKQMNLAIREQQEALDILESQSTGEVKVLAKASQDGLLEAKLTVEDRLPEAELANEMRDDLARLVARNLATTGDVAKDLSLALTEYKYLASEAAKSSLSQKQQVLQNAIASHNSQLQKDAEQQLAFETKRQATLVKVQEDAVKAAEAAIAAVQKATFQVVATQQAVATLRNGTQAVAGASTSAAKVTPTPTPK